LEIGDSVHISDVTLDKSVELTIKDRDFTVATIAGAAPTMTEEEEEEAAAAEEAAGEEAGEAEDGEDKESGGDGE